MESEIFSTISEYGLLAIVLFGVSWALWQGFKWLAQKADILIDTHIEFVNKTDQRLEKIEVDIDDIKEIDKKKQLLFEESIEMHKKSISILDRIEKNTQNGHLK